MALATPGGTESDATTKQESTPKLDGLFLSLLFSACFFRHGSMTLPGSRVCQTRGARHDLFSGRFATLVLQIPRLVLGIFPLPLLLPASRFVRSHLRTKSFPTDSSGSTGAVTSAGFPAVGDVPPLPSSPCPPRLSAGYNLARYIHLFLSLRSHVQCTSRITRSTYRFADKHEARFFLRGKLSLPIRRQIGSKGGSAARKAASLLIRAVPPATVVA